MTVQGYDLVGDIHGHADALPRRARFARLSSVSIHVASEGSASEINRYSNSRFLDFP
jgi:hypothetical protein